MARFIDLKGMRFGRLVAIRKLAPRNKRTFWLFECDCGTQKEIGAAHVCAGRVRSCGCLLSEVLKSEDHCNRLADAARKPRKHGMKGKPVYHVWKSMIQRCTNPKSRDWRWYGAMGVVVCDDWRDFRKFYADMGDPNGLTLDRKDPNGNYEKGNCEWVTWERQRLNKRKLRENHNAAA